MAASSTLRRDHVRRGRGAPDPGCSVDCRILESRIVGSRVTGRENVYGDRAPLHLFGLTGGIASGKSTVGERLRARGVPVVDADELAREVVAPGTEGLREVAEAFGARVLDAEWRRFVGCDNRLRH